MFKSNDAVQFTVSSQLNDWMRSIRRHLHTYPELSFREKATSLYIQEMLRQKGVTFQSGVAGTGVIASLGGPTDKVGVALRADMDALPVEEETGLDFSSKNSGVMHACGHDGHVAMLLGAAALLAERELPGPVKLLFQPAEEHGNGAWHFTQRGVLENIEEIYAGHIDTHFPIGTITVDEGIICAWADPFIVKLRGRSGHAARPHEAIDSLVAAANLVLSVQTLISRGIDPNKSAVITIGSLQAGTAQNIIAKESLLKGTIRATDYQTRKAAVEGLKRVVTSISQMHQVEAELEFVNVIPAVKNERTAVENARIAASRTAGLNIITSQGAPSLGAEDFAFYQEIIPGCMVRFGAAPAQGISVSHSGTFDFNEDVLALGASWYANVAWQWLSRKYNQNGKA